MNDNMIPVLTKRIEGISLTNPLIRKICTVYYRRLVRDEIAIASISHKDHILCIGGGPFPFTAIEFAKQTGAKVTVVDRDQEAIASARLLVDKLEISGEIEVVQAEGEMVNAQGYSHIHIALQVHPKEEVLSNICKQISPGTKILMRRTKMMFNHIFYGIRTDFCEKQVDYIDKYFRCVDCNLKNTILLVKNDMRVKNEKCDIIPNWDINPGRNTVDI